MATGITITLTDVASESGTFGSFDVTVAEVGLTIELQGPFSETPTPAQRVGLAMLDQMNLPGTAQALKDAVDRRRRKRREAPKVN